MTLALRPMTDGEVAAFLAAQRHEYADQLERFAGWSPEDARDKMERDMAETFPGGAVKPGHHLFRLVDEVVSGDVGALWYSEDDRGVWLYQITIDPPHRRRGYARQAMALLEEEARRRGASRIELNVFGGNEAARQLYRSLGYREEAVVMSKPVNRPRDSPDA